MGVNPGIVLTSLITRRSLPSGAVPRKKSMRASPLQSSAR
jgi:hypothetical protein